MTPDITTMSDPKEETASSESAVVTDTPSSPSAQPKEAIEPASSPSDQPDSAAQKPDPSQLPLPQQAARGWRFWAAFIPMCFGTLLAAFESTVTSTALPSIVEDLGSGNLYVWILNGYLLTSTALQPLYGQFAGVFGRRFPSMFAVAIFTLGSGISGGANSTTMLIAGRVVQGIGGGGISVMTQLIVSDLVSVRERGTYIGIVFAVFGLGTMVGPVIGGTIVEHISWRWVFYINLPVGGVALVLQYFFLQVTYKKIMGFRAKARMIDWVGNVLLIGSVVSILIALTWANTKYPWSSPKVLVPLLIGIAGTGLFHTFEASRYCVQPTIPPRLFLNRTCAVAMILTFAQSMLTFWWIYFLPVYFMSTKKVSTARSGVLLLPSVMAGIPTAVTSGWLLTKYGRYKPLHLAAFTLMTIAAGLFTLLDASSNLAEIVMFQVVAAFGVGCVLTTLLPAAQADLPQALVAPITATWAFMRSYGSIWGIAIPAAIFNSRFEDLHWRISDPVLRAELGGGSAYSHASDGSVRFLPPTIQKEVISVYSDSLKLVWRVAVGFSGLCFLLAFLEKEVSLRKTVETDFGLKEKEKSNKDAEIGFGANLE